MNPKTSALGKNWYLLLHFSLAPKTAMSGWKAPYKLNIAMKKPLKSKVPKFLGTENNGIALHCYQYNIYIIYIYIYMKEDAKHAGLTKHMPTVGRGHIIQKCCDL